MESMKLDRQRGQILVQVAIMVGVLLAFVALAVDAGNVYGGRRRMQNAADAGALAGAREICFGDPSQAEAKAHEYAEDRNGAAMATVAFPFTGTVVVTAEQTLDTFFAGVIGINTADVRGEAAAVCGALVSGGPIWPLAFDMHTFTDTICAEGREMQDFWAFADAPSNKPYCVGDCDDEVRDGDGNPVDDNWKFLCSEVLSDSVFGPGISTDNRGWLRLAPPPDEEDDPCGTYNCGQEYVNCWLKNSHPGPIQQGDCIVSKPGVGEDPDPLPIIESREDEIVNIVLWDDVCTSDDDPEPMGWKCQASDDRVYRVGALGCIQIRGYEEVSLENCKGEFKSFTVILAAAICDTDGYDECRSLTGGAYAEGDSAQSRGVSLIEWPRPGDE